MYFFLNKKVIGWLLSVILPALFYFINFQTKINWAILNFLVFFIAALVMWAFRLVAEYIPALFMIVSIVILGLVPTDVVLSGYMSHSFFMALSVFGIGAIIIYSGLFYRFSLFLLRHLPHKLFLLQIIIYVISILITPIMTAQSSRISMLVPMVNELTEVANLKKKQTAVNGLGMAVFSGTIYFSVIFMTGKSSNLVLYGMLPEQIKLQFTWLYWLKASSFSAFLIFILSLIQVKFGFNTNENIEVSKTLIATKIESLGSMRPIEWIAMFSVIFMTIGLIFSSSLNIHPTWISFSILVALMVLSVVDTEVFKKGINWPFLFYLGSMVGIMQSLQYLEINTKIIDHMNWLFSIIGSNIYFFIFITYILGFLSSFVFGTAAAPALMYTILSPISEHIYFNSWLLIFILLMATESWIFPYQSSYYLCFEEMTNRYGLVDQKHILRQNAIFVMSRLIIIFSSVWYWKKLGIL